MGKMAKVERSNNKMRRVINYLAVLAVLLVACGACQTVDRGYEGVISATDPDRVKLNTKLTWLHPQPNIRMVSSDQMYVYCRVRNSAGADVELEDAIKEALQDRDYRLTRNLDEAQFTISADLRYLGETATKKYDAVIAGGAIGAGTGAVIGHNVGDNNTGVGAVAGAAAGALLGDIIANRNKQREYSLVVDVRLGERIHGGVSTNRSGDDSQTTSSRAGASTGGGLESGSARGTTSETQSVELTEDFLNHQNRVIAKAESMNLTLAQAEPTLTRRLSKAIASSLP
jgi:hypothetical protein